MARFRREYIADDSSDTLYYELWYRIVGTTAWTQLTYTYPLPVYVSVSPAVNSAYIGIYPLADATDYECRLRRFNNDNQFSEWEDITFTTGS